MDPIDKQTQIDSIIKEFGKPERDFDRTPLNESARRIDALNGYGLQAYNQAKKAKKIERDIKELIKQIPTLIRAVPEEVIRPEYLVSFTDTQKIIVKQWLVNVNQTVKEIADTSGATTAAVRNVMSLEAFKLLRLNIAKGLLEIMPLEAIIAYRECLQSKQDNIKFNAADAILRDQGILKDKQPDNVMNQTQVVMDPERMKELEGQAKKLMGL